MANQRDTKQIRTDLDRGRRFLRANWHRLDGVLSDQNRGVPVPEPQKGCPAEATVISLPDPDDEVALGGSVREAIGGRCSRRAYSPEALSAAELSYLLWATQGVKRLAGNRVYRTTPSAGARQALDTYLYIDRVEGIDSGLYRYLPLHHSLCPVPYTSDDPSGTLDGTLAGALDDGLHGQLWNCAVLFIWVAVPYRMEWRYSVVAHKLILLDAGHVCQNLYIACESAGCGTCAIGAYDQKQMDRILGLDGENELVVYAAPVGKQ